MIAFFGRPADSNFILSISEIKISIEL